VTTEEFLTEFFRLTDEYDALNDWFWRVDDGKVRLFANCNDLFAWGCADLEQITPENIGILRQSMADCDQAEPKRSAGAIWGPSLFVARVRQMRPQGACYKGANPAITALLDACGPPREVGIGNPYPHPSEAATEAPK
jgi:hypothetical protein